MNEGGNKMRGMQKKTFLLQWGLPFIFLLIVMIAILARFTIVGRQQSIMRVKEAEQKAAEQYAHEFHEELNEMTQAGIPIADVIGSIHEKDTVLIRNLQMSVCNNTIAYQVIYADYTGKGFDQRGKQVDLSEEAYFKMVNKEQRYAYVESDCLNQKSAIVSIIPTNIGQADEGAMYVYYPIERFQELFQRFSYLENSFCALVLDQGNIVASVGDNSKFTASENLYNMLFAENEDESVQNAWHSIQERKTGYFLMENVSPKMFITYAPLGIDNWYMMIGSDNNRVERLVNKEWNILRQIVIQLAITIMFFIAFVSIISVVSKMNYNKHSKSLEIKADTDLLTDLYNKIATEREIKKYIAENPGKKALFFLVDIDNFKKINDTMGHAFGDEVLKTIGAGLRTEFRQSDIIGRIGGDEMVIFLKNLSDEKAMKIQMDKVAAFYQTVEVGEYVKYKVTASIGVSVYPAQGSDFVTLYEQADKALYHAKGQGKNCIYCEQSMG